MNQKITSVVKKSAKIGAAVCVAAGAIALMTSGAALKALTEGGRYLKNTVKKIIGETDAAESAVVEAASDAEAVEEADFVEDASTHE